MAGTLPADKRRQGSFLLRLFGCFSSASVAGRTSISQSIITAEASKSETGESEGAASKQQPESSEVFSNLEAQHREDCGSARDESGAGSKMDKAGKEANVNIQLDADALDLAEGSLRCSPAVEQESHLPSCFSDSRRGQEGYDQSALFSIAERCECSMPDLPQVATGTQQRNSPPPQDKSIHYEVAFTGPNSSTAQSLSASFDDAASQLPSILVLDSDAPSAESSGFTRSSGVGSLFGLDSPVSEAFKHFQGIQFSVASSYNTADNSLNNSLVKTASLVPAVVTALASHSNTADISNSSLMGAGPHASIGRQGSTVTDRSPSKSLRPIRYLSDSGVGAPGSSKAPIPQLGVYNYLFSNCKLPLGGRTSAGIPVARASLPSTSQIKLASELGSHTQTQPSSLGPHTSTKWNRSAAQLRLLDSPNGGVHGVYTNLVAAAAAAAPGSPSGAVDGKEWPGFTHMPLQLAPAPLLVVPLSPSPAHVNQTTSLPLPGVAASQSANRLDPAGWVATSNEHAFASERASDRSDSDVVVSASFFLLPADGERGWYDPQGGAGTGLQGSGYRVSFGSTQASSSGRISISVTRSDSKNGLFLDAVLGASTSGRFAHSLSRSKSDSTLDTTSLGSNVSLWAEPTPTSTPTPMPTPMSTSIPTPMSTSQVPVISRVSAVRPRQTQPSMDEPSTAQPRTVHPVQNQPSSAQPSTLQPRQTPPSVAEPSTAQPRQTQPSTAQLRTLQRSQGQASPAEPPMGESSRSHPSVSSPSTDEHRKRVPGEASQASLSYPPPTKQVSEGDLPGGLGFDVLNVQGKWNQSDLYACRPDHTTNAGNATTAQSIRTNAGNATTAQSIPTNTGNPCNQVQDARLAPCLCGKQGQATTLTVDGHQGAQGQATTPGLDGHQGTQGQATSGNRGSNRTPQGQATFGLRGSGSGAQGQATTAAAGMVSNQGPSNDALSLSQDPNPEPCRVHKQDPNPLDPASMVTQQELSNDALSLSQAPNLEPCRVHKQDPNPLDSASMVSKQELSKDALSLSQAPHLEPCRMHKQDPNPLDPASMVSKQELSNDALSMSQAPNLEPHCVDKQAPNSLDPASMVSKQELSNAAPSQSQATSPQAKPSPHAASQDPTPQAKPRPHAASQDPTPQAKPSTHGASQAPTLAPYVARKKLLKARGPTKVANPVPSRDDPPSEELQQKIKVRRSFKSDPKPGSGRDSIISSWAGSKRSIQVNLMESQRGAQQLRQGQATMESPRGAQPLRQCQATLESQRGAQPLRQGQATMESPRGNQPLRQCQATLESQRGAEQLRQGQATLESQRGAEQLQQGQATKGPQAPLPHQKQGGLGLPPSGGGPAPPRSQEGRTRDTKGGKGRRGGEWKSVCVSAGGPREEGSSVYSGRTACKEGARVERKAARMGYMLRSKLTGLVYELSKAGTGRSSAAGSGVAPLARSGVVPSAGRCVVPSAGSGVVPSAQSGVVPSAGSGVAPPGGVAPQSGAPPRSAGGAATHHSLTKREPSNLPSFTDPLRPSGPPSGHPSVTDLLQLSGHPSGHPSVTNLLHPSVTDLLHPSGPPSAPPSGPPSVTDLLHPSAPPSPNMLDGSASNSFRPFSFNPPVLEQSKTCTHETAASSASSQQQQQWEQQRQRLSQTRSSKDLSQAQVPPASSASSHHQQQQWQQQQHQPLSHTRMSKDLSPPQESPASAASSHQQQRQQRSDTRSSKDLSHDLSPPQESPASAASSHQQQWQQQRSDTRSSKDLSHAQESPASAASSQQQQQWQQQQQQLSHTQSFKDLSHGHGSRGLHGVLGGGVLMPPVNQNGLPEPPRRVSSFGSQVPGTKFVRSVSVCDMALSSNCSSNPRPGRSLLGNSNNSNYSNNSNGSKDCPTEQTLNMCRGLLENSNNSNYSKNSNYSNNSNGSKGCPTEQTLNEMMYDSGNSIQAGSSSRAGTNHKAWQRGGRSGVAKLAPVVASVDDDEDSEDSDKDSPSFKGSKISRYPLTKQRSTWRTMFEPMNLALSARESNDMR
eukprot:gene29144-32363_t